MADDKTMIGEMPIEQEKWPSEVAGMEGIKTISLKEDALPFHQHTGFDNSPQIDLLMVDNKEESQGGKFNNQLYDNSGFSTTSATYVAYTAINKTITQDTNEKRYLLLFSAAFRASSAGTDVRFTFEINGTNQSDFIVVADSGGASESHPCSMHFITDKLAQSASGHTFKVMCKTNAGTLYVDGSNFSAIEIIS